MRTRAPEKQFTCHECGSTGSLRWMETHPCEHNAYVKESGGRCEDFPCCGHTDGDGCAALESHTSEFYVRNPHLLHEPGSPEWYDAMDEMNDYDEDDADELTCEHLDWDTPGGIVTCHFCLGVLHIFPMPEDAAFTYWW